MNSVASIDASMLDASPGLSIGVCPGTRGSLAVCICVESPDRPKATQAFHTGHVRFELLVFVLPPRLLRARPCILHGLPYAVLPPRARPLSHHRPRSTAAHAAARLSPLLSTSDLKHCPSPGPALQPFSPAGARGPAGGQPWWSARHRTGDYSRKDNQGHCVHVRSQHNSIHEDMAVRICIYYFERISSH